MDPELTREFQNAIHKLLEKREEDPVIQHVNYQGLTLSLISEMTKEQTDRFNKVKEITGAKLPILLACKSKEFWKQVEKRQNDSLDFTIKRQGKKKPRTASSISNSDQSAIDGSPLKLDIIADLSLEDESICVGPTTKQTFIDFGLSQTVCRMLSSLYSNYFTSSKEEIILKDGMKSPTLIALCDGQNFKSLSCQCLEPIIDKQNNLKGVKITNVMSKPSAEKSQHMKIKPAFGPSEVLCQAKYDIITKAEDSQHEDLQSSLMLELEWRKLSGNSVILLHDPPLEAKARVKVQVTSGGTRSQAFGLYQELNILGAIIYGLETSEVNWIGTQECPLVDSVKDLVEQLKLGSDIVQCNLGNSSQDENCKTEFESLIQEERKDLDFTDHLWKILQNCTSYTDLVEAFNLIISALRQGDLLPFIHSYNTTNIACMVKDSYQGQLRGVSLSGMYPLEYLAEMGVQKLLHDYIHIFLSRNLLTLSQLEFYMKGNLTLQQKMERLTRLHNTLEVVILLKQYLHLTQATLCDSTRQMLKFYESNSVDSAHFFTFSVPTNLLINIIEIYAPTEWRATCLKEVGGVPQHTAYHFTSELPFDWIGEEAKSPRARGSCGDVDEPDYFLTVLQDSVSILG